MKIEQLLAQHLYQAKELTLQGVGKFTLTDDFVLPAENDKDFVMPANAISFEYNNKATEDDALIKYIVEHTRKIKPLASADLDSYLTLCKQFLNIGKPFVIEGIGTLEKSQPGEFHFTAGQFVHTKADNGSNTAVKEKIENEISFASKPKEKKSPNKAIMLLGLAVLLGLISWGVWYFITKQNPVTSPTVTVPETTGNTAMQKDTAKKDTVSLNPVALAPKDSFTFKVVIKNYNDFATANKSYTKLTSYGHKLVLYTKDSVTYKVAMPFMKPLSDTGIVRDSLKKKLFGGTPYIEIN